MNIKSWFMSVQFVTPKFSINIYIFERLDNLKQKILFLIWLFFENFTRITAYNKSDKKIKFIHIDGISSSKVNKISNRFNIKFWYLVQYK